MSIARGLALATALLAGGLSPSPSAQQPVPAWTRGAVCYEIFVRSFYDSDGDGIGDLNGLIQKLDYINDGTPSVERDLGASCIWLMPVAQSPSYHGYDVTDYYRVERDYGTNEDFKRLVVQAHRRGIHVLVDLVLNHASSEHPFFQDALRDPGSPYRDWFRWSATRPEGEDNWHRSPVRDEYYYGFFWSGMPDLNFATPAVREEAKKVARFWLEEMGVDGFRLDAVRHLVEEGRLVQNAPGTHAVLKDFAAHVRRVKADAFTIGEVWDSTGAVLAYYPEQLDAYFAFEVSDAILDAVRTGSATKLLLPVLRLQRELPAERWSPFLRNHDQTRTLTVLGGDLARARLAATLLLTLPGFPFVYYGEEIGMTGDKPDPRLRTPMQWSPRPGVGFTPGTPWETPQADSMTTNVAAQDADTASLLNLYRRLIHLRQQNEALATGRLVPLATGSTQVAAYLRRAGSRAVLVVANLGAAAVSGLTIDSKAGALPPGRYTPRTLLGGPNGATLRVSGDGGIRDYAPVATIGPRKTLVLDVRE